MKRFLLTLTIFFLPQLALAGSQTYSTPGTYSFTVPSSYGSLVVVVRGAGGGGGSAVAHAITYNSLPGSTGGISLFGSVSASGGAGGTSNGSSCDTIAASGSGSGGTINKTGGGAAGGSGGTGQSYCNGATPNDGGNGGTGGLSIHAYTPTTLTQGSSVSVTVGAGGSAGGDGTSGGSGSVDIFWTNGAGGSVSSSATYSSSGTFTTPSSYGSLIAVVRGAGGGGGGPTARTLFTTDGSPGGASAFGSLSASGGSGGVRAYCNTRGSDGSGSGGDLNKTGGGASGGAGGSYGYCWSSGQAGGDGGLSVALYTPSILATSSQVPVTIGSGGASGGGAAANGSNGTVDLFWTDAASCTFNGSTVVHGASITANQSATVPYGFSCVSQTRTCNNGTLSGSFQYSACTVNPPPPPTATLTLPQQAYVGQAFSVSSTFTAGSGDTLQEDNIDWGFPGPPTYGQGANTFPSSPKSFSTTTMLAGTHTFYAKARTNNYAWATYDTQTLTVTLPNTPTATLTVNSGTHYANQPLTITATFSTSTGDTLLEDNVDSPLGTGLGTNTNPSLTKIISYTPSAPGTYTFYARGRSSARPSWATYQTLDVVVVASCAPSTVYSCSGSNIVQTSTNAQCAVTTNNSYDTCDSPTFCSAGSAVCINPTPSFSPSGNLTGHLQVFPSIVAVNSPTTVYWNVSNVSSCSVTGSNGDGAWTTTSGPHTTSNILSRTVYTLDCTKLNGAHLVESAVVNVAPVFLER